MTHASVGKQNYFQWHERKQRALANVEKQRVSDNGDQ